MIGVVITIVETTEVADVPDLAGLPIGIMTGFAFLVGARVLDGVGHHRHVHQRQGQRPHGVGRPAQPRRGGPGRDARRGRLRASSSSPCRCSACGASSPLYEAVVADVTVAEAPFLIVGFGFGASFVALFAQLGGGIYTKAADVGSDLVGKVEKGIPEDDPRNAGVVADLVGDNVGDCAGRGADLFESTAAENIGAMILGVAVYAIAVAAGWPNPEAWIFFPLVVRAFGLLATIVAIFFVRGKEDEDPMNMLNRGYWVTTLLSVVGLAFTTNVMMNTNGGTGEPSACRRGSTSSSPASSASPRASRSSTSPSTTPRARTAPSGRSPRRPRPARPPTSSAAPRSASRRPSSPLSRSRSPSSRASGSGTGGSRSATGGRNVGGIFGTAVATMGMLMTTAYILAMDTFGPITDNAGGIAEFSRAEAGAREITDRLDAVGNTTKALTKGYAIASASLAAFLLFSAYIDKINVIQGRRIEAGVPGAELLELGQPGQRQRVHRGAARGDARVLLQLARHPRGRQDGPGDHRRGPPPVPRDARDHGLHPAPGLRPGRRHHHQGRPQAR